MVLRSDLGVAQVSLIFTQSSDLSLSSAEITGVRHYTWLEGPIFKRSVCEVCSWPPRPNEILACPGARVAGIYGFLDVGIGIQTPVL